MQGDGLPAMFFSIRSSVAGARRTSCSAARSSMDSSTVRCRKDTPKACIASDELHVDPAVEQDWQQSL